ncbi:hypothetical protein AeRB84_016479 [Aphanomyces euteiches]|nr:hypothetical protein AeRB84_016479 [Aphanomyces euteiches]
MSRWNCSFNQRVGNYCSRHAIDKLTANINASGFVEAAPAKCQTEPMTTEMEADEISPQLEQGAIAKLPIKQLRNDAMYSEDFPIADLYTYTVQWYDVEFPAL